MRQAILLLGILTELSVFASDGAKETVLSGAYSPAQANRGEAAYLMHCARCHGDDLSGRAMGPLKGDKFMDRWREDSLGVLFDHIRTKMPASDPGSLPEATYLDVLAYLLQQNSIPPGTRDLTAEGVAGWKLVGKDGPKPLSTNTLVQVAGCFIEDKNDWLLAGAADPIRTHTPEQITDEELKNAAAEPGGAQTFRLQNLEDMAPGFQPEKIRNRRVLVKGVLVRHANLDHVNVLRLEAAATACSR